MEAVWGQAKNIASGISKEAKKAFDAVASMFDEL